MPHIVSAKTALVLRSVESAAFVAVAVFFTAGLLTHRFAADTFLVVVLVASYALSGVTIAGAVRCYGRVKAGAARRPSEAARRAAILAAPGGVEGEIESLRYAGVAVSRDRFAQVERGTATVSVRRAEVRTAELKYGPPSTSPALQLVVGVAVILVGLLPLVAIYGLYLGYPLAFPRATVAWFAWLVPGGWIAREAVSKRLFLRVATDAKTWILVFERDADAATAAAFADAARRDLGVPIAVDASVLDIARAA